VWRYSVEDEAVVAGILTGPGGDEFELEAGAVERGVPGVKFRPGLCTWLVGEHHLTGAAAAAGRNMRVVNRVAGAAGGGGRGARGGGRGARGEVAGRGFYSSTSLLNLSRVCH
jgi:hypothetical protein